MSDDTNEGLIEKRPMQTSLERAMSVLSEHGYVYEREGVYRDRMQHLNDRAEGTSMQNGRGQWVPAIPEPLFLSWGRVRCDCGEVRRGRRAYREHFALAHILGVSA